MTGKDIYSLGKNSTEARSKVPLNFVHTPPRLTFDENWHAEFWYFLQTVRGKIISVSAPRLFLKFELPSKRLIQFEHLESNDKDSLSEAPELASKEFYTALNEYLNFCNDIIAKVPDMQILTKADEMWKKTLPRCFHDLQEKMLNRPHAEFAQTITTSQEVSKTSDSSLEQYQWEMSQAIQNGDSMTYEEAKRKYDELKAR